MDTGWFVGSVVLIVGALVVAVGALLVLLESRYRAASDKKDWIIAVLREEIRMAKKHDASRKVAATAWSKASDLELNTLALRVGPPRLLEMLLFLTDHVSIALQRNPSRESPQWKERGRPAPEEMQRNAAILVLWDRDYISGVLPAGYDGYSMIASNGAMAIRAIYNRFPESFKIYISEIHRVSSHWPH